MQSANGKFCRCDDVTFEFAQCQAPSTSAQVDGELDSAQFPLDCWPLPAPWDTPTPKSGHRDGSTVLPVCEEPSAQTRPPGSPIGESSSHITPSELALICFFLPAINGVSEMGCGCLPCILTAFGPHLIPCLAPWGCSCLMSACATPQHVTGTPGCLASGYWASVRRTESFLVAWRRWAGSYLAIAASRKGTEPLYLSYSLGHAVNVTCGTQQMSVAFECYPSKAFPEALAFNPWSA